MQAKNELQTRTQRLDRRRPASRDDLEAAHRAAMEKGPRIDSSCEATAE